MSEHYLVTHELGQPLDGSFQLEIAEGVMPQLASVTSIEEHRREAAIRHAHFAPVVEAPTTVSAEEAEETTPGRRGARFILVNSIDTNAPKIGQATGSLVEELAFAFAARDTQPTLRRNPRPLGGFAVKAEAA